MKYQNKNMDSDWAKQVPDIHDRGPYEDYGWDPGESVLPEFRDPSVHLTPSERRQRGSETHRYGRRVMPDHEQNDYGWSEYYGEPYYRGYFSEQNQGTQEPWLRPGPFTGRGPRGYRRGDERITEDVNRRLTEHGQINAHSIQVETHEGVVTLRGTVNNRRVKRMAEDTALSVFGVEDVNNQLTIQQKQEANG